MHGEISLFLADPGRRSFETPRRRVILLGLWKKTLPDPARFMDLPGPGIVRFLAEYEIDGCCIVAEKDGEGALARAYACRGPATAHGIYMSTGPEGGRVLSDTFKGALESLPLPLRDASPEGFLDFLLFQASPLPESPVSAIKSLGHGDLLDIERDGTSRISPLSRLEIPEPCVDFREGVERIEETLSLAVENLPDGVVNLLSGGVDSTLVQVLLGPGHGAVTASIDSPEFAFERGYAARAACLCGVSRQEIFLSEGDFLHLLERETSLAKMPLSLLQNSLIAAAFDCQASRFSSGFNADSFFSLSRPRRKLVREGAFPTSFPAEAFSVSSERPILESIFGKEAIEKRIRERTEYVLGRVREPESLSGLNLGCLLSYFCSSFSIYLQQAAARGKTLDSLFMGRRLVEAALAMPVPERVCRKGVFKPVLKDILSSHLPGYPLELEKGGSGLPRTRFCQSGPLKGYFRENPLPKFVPKEKAGPILEPLWESSMTTYRCIAWSLWEKCLGFKGTGRGIG